MKSSRPLRFRTSRQDPTALPAHNSLRTGRKRTQRLAAAARSATELLKSARYAAPRHADSPAFQRAASARSHVPAGIRSFHRRYLQVIIGRSWRNIESPRSVALTG
jgi:hypothetical protein